VYSTIEKSYNISIVRLKLLPILHSQPIYVVVCNELGLNINQDYRGGDSSFICLQLFAPDS